MMKQLLVRILPLVALGIAGFAQAVTLGEARVKSFLHQPLDAEIGLIGVEPGEHESLRLRLANQRDFDRLKIENRRYLSSLEFDVVQSDGQWLVRVRSRRPISEPFIDFPLQLNWPGGQLIKQYTLLLDPPTRIRTARKSAATRSAPQPAGQPRSAAPATPSAPQFASYGPVQRGETLWPIAQRLKPGGITTQQMAMALLRANPQAFSDGNVNRLHAGATLSIPTRDFIEQMDAATARAEFAAQTRQWRAPVATSPRPVEGAQVATATTALDPADATPEPVPTEPAQPEPATDSGDQLRIMTDKDATDSTTPTEEALHDQLLVTMEEIESNRITTQAIASRITGMEAELDRMQKLIELKDAQIEALESEVAARTGIDGKNGPAMPGPSVTLGAPVSGEPPVAAVDAVPAQPAPGEITPIRVETDPVYATPPAGRPWYEEYVWVSWALMGLLGLTSLLLLLRRPQYVPAEAQPMGLPSVDGDATAAFRSRTAPPPEALRQAEEDLRTAATQIRPRGYKEPDTEELPELELPRARSRDQDIDDGITRMTGAGLANRSPETSDPPRRPAGPSELGADFTDDDITSWVAELDAEVDRARVQSANDEGVEVDDDEIPSILTELDDRLSSVTSTDGLRVPAPDDHSARGAVEDDTFSMSLDLARAYLEIGDQEGAKDMLMQALTGARDPEHRRQIEELLQQID